MITILPNDIQDLILNYAYGQKSSHDVEGMTSIIKNIHDSNFDVEKYFDQLSHFYSIRLNIDKMMILLCDNKTVPLDYYVNNIDCLKWKLLCKNSNVPEEFFEKHIDKVDWEALCCNTGISEAFFDKYSNKIDEDGWILLFANSNISETFFEKYIDTIKLTEEYYYSYLIERDDISEQFIEKHLEVFNHEIIWIFLCCRTNISEAFFDKHSGMLNDDCWVKLSENSNISEAFFRKHINQLDQRCFMKLHLRTDMSDIFEQFFKDNLILNRDNNKDINISYNFYDNNAHHSINASAQDWYDMYYNINISDRYLIAHMPKLKQFDWNILKSYGLDHDDIELYKDVTDSPRFQNLYVNINNKEEFMLRHHDIDIYEKDCRDVRLQNLISRCIFRIHCT